jgi:uncharacterized protein (TIGR03083 family)
VDKPALLDQLRCDAGAFAALCDVTDLHIPVPTCPPWTLGELVGHLGSLVHVFGSHLADERPDRRISRRSGPPAPLGDPRPWFRQEAAVTIARLAVADFEHPAPTFLGRRTAGWWARRAMLELNLHRYDAELATGCQPEEATPVPEEVGVIGVNEMTELIQAYGNVLSEHLQGHTIHLDGPDEEGHQWLVHLGRPVTVSHAHGPSDVGVRASAGTLVRLLWNRPASGPVEVTGDRSVLDDLLSMVRI